MTDAIARLKLLATAATHPKALAKALVAIEKQGVENIKSKLGATTRKGVIYKGGKKIATAQIQANVHNPVLKTGIVSGAGAVTSMVGGHIAGIPGALIGDNLGAVAMRRAVNKGYATLRTKEKAARLRAAGKILAPSDEAKMTEKTRKALERLDSRNNENISDQVGWGVGNAFALATQNIPGIGGLPLRGGVVAMRTVPSISPNVRKVIQGTQNAREALLATGEEILNSHNPQLAIQKFLESRRITQAERQALKESLKQKSIRRGNARERLLRMRLLEEIEKSQYSFPYPQLTQFTQRPIDRLRFKVYANRHTKLLKEISGYPLTNRVSASRVRFA